MRMIGSSVVATKYALRVLIDVQASDREKLFQDGIAYLLQNYDPAGQLWPMVTADVMDAPHAPWWDFDGLEKEFGGFLANPRAGILRCFLNYADLIPSDFLDELTATVVAYFKTLPVEINFFDAMCFLLLVESAGLGNEHRELLLTKLRMTAGKIVNIDPEAWRSFSVKPLWLAPSPQAPLAKVFDEALQKNLDFEIENQCPDGSWSPTWSWRGTYLESWSVAAREWRGVLTLAMPRSLRDFGRIDGCPAGIENAIYKYHLG